MGKLHRTLGVDAMSEDALSASMAAILDGHPSGADIWVFGYGSLVWNALLSAVERRVARLEGYQRRFCLWSRVARGTPLRPGLVLGLESGGFCEGVALRIPALKLRTELTCLWRREMIANLYQPLWVMIDVGHQRVKGLTFVANTCQPNYAEDLPNAALVDALSNAKGTFGSCLSYFHNTLAGLRGNGIEDPYLNTLSRWLPAAA